MKKSLILIVAILLVATACSASPTALQQSDVVATVGAMSVADLEALDDSVADAAPELNTALVQLEEQAGIEPVPQAQAAVSTTG